MNPVQFMKDNASVKTIAATVMTLGLIAGGTAAVTTIFSNTVTGQGSVDKGLEYRDVTASGAASLVGSGKSYDYNVDLKQGSSFSFGATLENMANDKSEPFTEVVIIDGDKDLNHKTLENVSFKAYTTQASSKYHLNKSNPLQLHVSYDGKGNIDEDNRGPYLQVTSADLPGYSQDSGKKEILVCIGDNLGNQAVSKSEGDGNQFEAGEIWDKQFNINTQSTFPETANLTVELRSESLFNPESSDGVNSFIMNCPQYQVPS